jgi:hypothetical protein
MSLLSEGSQSGWSWVWLALPASVLVWGIFSSIKRNRDMKKFAASHNLAYSGNTLLKSTTLKGNSFYLRSHSISNSMFGTFKGIDLAIFDLRIGQGKGGYQQTVVAFPRRAEIACSEPPIDAIGSFEFELAGDWLLGYIKRRIVSTDELEDWCIELYSLTRDLINEGSGVGASGTHLFRWMS